jgi:DNA polymerase-3 subunit gamma/tau
MEKKSLELEYRPKTFDEFHGNGSMIKALREDIKRKKTHLFYGPRGCGKTTLARICTNEIGCHERYIREYDTAVMGLKDSAREINRECRIVPHKGNMAFIFDEPQDASDGFMGAMLKTLEEPPPKAWFFLCTTNPEKLRKAGLSRCSDHEVKPLDKKTSAIMMRDVLKKEGKSISMEVIKRIYDACGGIPREMLIILGKIVNLASETEQIENIRAITDQDSTQINELVQAFLKKRDWNEINNIVNELKGQPVESLRRAILGYVDAICARKDSQELFDIGEQFSKNMYDSGVFGFRNACRNAWMVAK